MKIQSLELLLNHSLQELYSTENQLAVALPNLIEASGDAKLTEALKDHLELTKGHISRLEEIANKLTLDLTAAQDKTMSQLISSSDSLIQSCADQETTTAAVEFVAEKSEHYEMATYESAIILAKKLGKDSLILDDLKATYKEEKEAADKVKSIAQGGIMQEIADAISM